MSFQMGEIGCSNLLGGRGKSGVVLFMLMIFVLLEDSMGLPNMRGISPEDEKYYQTAVIKCKDGSKKFSQERLNDDYCDCVDGTDEPGTNACPEAKFYCKNNGHRPLVLFSSRVNDGICDCCDGSDEYGGKARCTNTCWEAGKVSREKLKKKLATFKDGLSLRNREVEQAKQALEMHRTEILPLKQEEKTVKDLLAKLTVVKEALEEAERQEQVEREKLEQLEREKQEKLDREKREKDVQESIEHEKSTPKAETEQTQEPALEEVDVSSEASSQQDTLSSTFDGDKEIYGEQINGGLNGNEVALEELSKEDLGRVIASRWTGEDVSDINIPSTTPNLDEQGEEQDDMHESEDDTSDEDDSALDQSDIEDDEHEEDTWSESTNPPAPVSEKKLSWWSRALVYPKSLLSWVGLSRRPVDKSEADRIRNQYKETSEHLNHIQSKINDLESRISQDYGKDGEFFSFYDQCFELKLKKYVYKVCPYKQATQVEGHSTTRLGSWKGFSEDYTSMIFTGGDRCWNGPDRSLRVRMRCGLKVELRSVEEPSRCDYVGEFSTPSLCLESKVQALEQQWHGQDGDLLGSHDEL